MTNQISASCLMVAVSIDLTLASGTRAFADVYTCIDNCESFFEEELRQCRPMDSLEEKRSCKREATESYRSCARHCRE